MIISLSDILGIKLLELIPTEVISVRESELLARLGCATEWVLAWTPRDGVLEDDASIDVGSIMVSSRRDKLMTAAVVRCTV